MEWIGWGLFVVLLLWYVTREMWYARRGNHLAYYAIWLLLNDEVREAHKKNVAEFVAKSDAPNPAVLCAQFSMAVEQMAHKLATNIEPGTSLVLLAPAMLWDLKTKGATR